MPGDSPVGVHDGTHRGGAGRRQVIVAPDLISGRPRAMSCATLPIGRVEDRPTSRPSPHLMTNTAMTGAAYDIDGGQRLIA
jgi:hypothetical protein